MDLKLDFAKKHQKFGWILTKFRVNLKIWVNLRNWKLQNSRLLAGRERLLFWKTSPLLPLPSPGVGGARVPPRRNRFKRGRKPFWWSTVEGRAAGGESSRHGRPWTVCAVTCATTPASSRGTSWWRTSRRFTSGEGRRKTTWTISARALPLPHPAQGRAQKSHHHPAQCQVKF